MNRRIIVAAILAAVAIPILAYTAGPLFVNNYVDEPAPQVGGSVDMGAPTGNETSYQPAALEGTFQGAGDGFHNAEGLARIIAGNEGKILRLEDFKATNGPDLYVYLSSDASAGEYVSLGRLKANTGNQNYEIPEGTDLSKYGTVLIWCQQFSVLFGSAELGAKV